MTIKRKKASTPRVSRFEERLTKLEREIIQMKTDFGSVVKDLSTLQETVDEMDERAVRGERIMLEMQGEQRATGKTIDRIAERVIDETDGTSGG